MVLMNKVKKRRSKKLFLWNFSNTEEGIRLIKIVFDTYNVRPSILEVYLP